MYAKGDKLDHFTIVGEIGRGGMGTIYKALDEMLNRHVAIKIIHPLLANDDQLMERFKTEAMTQAQLNHPNIVTVHSFNRIGADFVMVMEYVDGQSLKEIISKEHFLQIGVAIAIMKSVLAGLAYAHDKQVIHRDVKPANILIGDNGTVKLLDFGIAKIFGTQGMTKTGALIGTPWYCSPEQILGEEMDYRTDIYSASITFYQMITGRVPFDSETNSEYQIQKAQLETPPPRPSLYNGMINRQLEHIVLKGLAKKKEKRYASAKEMAEDLKKIEGDYRSIATETDHKTPITSRRHRLYKWFWFLIPLALFLLFLTLKKEQKIHMDNKTKISQITTSQTEPVQATTSSFPESYSADLPQKNEAKGEKPKKNTIQQQPIAVIKSNPAVKPSKDQNQANSQAPIKDESSDRPALTTDPDQVSKIDDTLLSTQKLFDSGHHLQAERMIERLLKHKPLPNALILAGTIKFFAGKYRQGELLWQRGLDTGAEIRLKVAHAHGFVERGCYGTLNVTQKLIQFDSSSKSEHSFVIMSGDLVSVSERGPQLLLSWKDKGDKVHRDFFSFEWSRDELDSKRLAAFLNMLFKED